MSNLELLNFAVEVEVTVEGVVVRGRFVVAVANQILVKVHHLLIELPSPFLSENRQFFLEPSSLAWPLLLVLF